MLSHTGFEAGTQDFYPSDVTVESLGFFFPLLGVFTWNEFSIQVLKTFAMQIHLRVWLLSAKINDRMR